MRNAQLFGATGTTMTHLRQPRVDQSKECRPFNERQCFATVSPMMAVFFGALSLRRRLRRGGTAGSGTEPIDILLVSSATVCAFVRPWVIVESEQHGSCIRRPGEPTRHTHTACTVPLSSLHRRTSAGARFWPTPASSRHPPTAFCVSHARTHAGCDHLQPWCLRCSRSISS